MFCSWCSTQPANTALSRAILLLLPLPLPPPLILLLLPLLLLAPVLAEGADEPVRPVKPLKGLAPAAAGALPRAAEEAPESFLWAARGRRGGEEGRGG